MNIDGYANVATITGGLAALFGGGHFLWRMGQHRNRIRDAILGSDTQRGLVERFDNLEQEVDEIKLRTGQLLRNGGSTLADSVTRHERECEQTHLQLITLVSELVK